MEHVIKKWNFVWQHYFDWIRSATIVEKVIMSLAFSFLTGVSAQIVIKLPFTPVPITGQVFMVLLTGVLLGKNWAVVSQSTYLIGGITKIPWFSGGTGGLTHIFLPSLGYIIGFIPASFFVGYITSTNTKSFKFTNLVLLMLCGISIIYIFGATWFSFVMRTDLKQTLLLSVIPFIPFDILKAYLVALLASAIISRSEN
ncbi:MAG TPA: biotin transporter BioY [bacterium]|nr:biotin transporter BioY [bacterium]HOL34268.1 biotin transporter BioY [bacterium]HPP07676.1 biotin transporter BioY [bacterium]